MTSASSGKFTLHRRLVATLLVFVIGDVVGAADAPDAAAGKAYFEKTCAQCHSAVDGDGGGEIGPTLFNLIGRQAGTGDTQFPYSKALKDSKLVWSGESLDRFLENPVAAVPGTTMPMPVPEKKDRGNLIAFFQSLIASR
jgi:cytochrome c